MGDSVDLLRCTMKNYIHFVSYRISRRTRSMLPCKTTDYTPQVQAEVQSTFIRKGQTAKTYYDRHTKPLPDLTIGQPVRVFSDRNVLLLKEDEEVRRRRCR